ncbi:glycine zipper family protein [Geobacter hydrogenophilus]|uniref:Lipoprotein n=1 Tax=Geobacter hydrogenophilus TaxID=40983 RepID=A0A9W6G091_9BACT|nr:glycine zipper family protein [Geobacter hydrogenophilus]MBT0894040.1 glycine zipper family protein [Geobacter hydrogenophilus]GLI38013.1 lipoprotein [Geobacter hydrogenophilus]
MKHAMLKNGATLLVPLMLVSACTPYRSQYVGFRPAEDYVNRLVVSGVTIGGEAFADSGAAQDAFGFDIKGSGLIPAQIVMTNQGRKNLEIVSGQTFLVNDQNRYFQVVPNAVAVDRIEKSTQFASFFGSETGKGAVLGAVGGAVLGAAVGIVSGRGIGEAIGKGAAIGGAGGAVAGGLKGGTSGERERTIINDIRAKGLEGKTIPAGSIASGFLFFPAEADTARELRLQLRDQDTGEIHNVVLKFK